MQAGLGHVSEVDCMLAIHTSLGSIFSTKEKNKQVQACCLCSEKFTENKVPAQGYMFFHKNNKVLWHNLKNYESIEMCLYYYAEY